MQLTYNFNNQQNIKKQQLFNLFNDFNKTLMKGISFHGIAHNGPYKTYYPFDYLIKEVGEKLNNKWVNTYYFYLSFNKSSLWLKVNIDKSNPNILIKYQEFDENNKVFIDVTTIKNKIIVNKSNIIDIKTWELKHPNYGFLHLVQYKKLINAEKILAFNHEE